MRRVPWDAIASALLLIALGVGLWMWQGHVAHLAKKLMPQESWSHVKERFPMPEPLIPAAELSADVLEGVVRANPFSPDRRRVEQPEVAEAPVAPPPPPPAQFVYKGRVVMGDKQRAILEETTAKKTYFLQVGQEVAGFKVLDISETRVLLSDSQKHEDIEVALTDPHATKPGSSGVVER